MSTLLGLLQTLGFAAAFVLGGLAAAIVREGSAAVLPVLIGVFVAGAVGGYVAGRADGIAHMSARLRGRVPFLRFEPRVPDVQRDALLRLQRRAARRRT